MCCEFHATVPSIIIVYHKKSISFRRVIINNTNDAPVISLNGVMDPVSQQLSTSYTEGTGAQTIVPNILVVDTDPDSMINRYTITYNNLLIVDKTILIWL